MDHTSFTHSSSEERFGCFQFEAVVKKVAINIYAHGSSNERKFAFHLGNSVDVEMQSLGPMANTCSPL